MQNVNMATNGKNNCGLHLVFAFILERRASFALVSSSGSIDKVKNCAILKKKGNMINFPKVYLLMVCMHMVLYEYYVCVHVVLYEYYVCVHMVLYDYYALAVV